MMRTPWIGHSICRNSRASVGLALVLRPKNVTSTPLVKYWSTSMATCWPFCRACASFSGASRPAGISVPIFTERSSSMMRSAEAMLGRRYRIAASSPCATAASAGSSQLPRWPVKISAGLPSSRSWANNSWVRVGISIRLSWGRAGSCSQIWSRCENSAPRRPRLSQTPAIMVSISAGDFSGNAAVRLARPIFCSRVIGPTRRRIRPNRFAVLIGSK